MQSRQPSSFPMVRLLLALWLFQIAAYFVPAATWNPVSRFALTHALVEEGRLSIDTLADATGDRALVEGHWYTDKSPMASLLAVPAYTAVRWVHRATGRQQPGFKVLRSTPEIPAIRLEVNKPFSQLLYACSVATGALPFALLGALLFTFLARRFSARAALLATLFTLLGTPLLPYASSFTGH